MQGLGINLSWVATPAAVTPVLPEHHVPRLSLVALLQASRHRLSLLCAPAGYGKTVLLGESFSGCQGNEQTLWLCWGGRALSLAEFTQQLSDALGLPSNPGGAGLLHYFSGCGRPVRLVLDDLPGDLSIELNQWFEHLLNLPESHLRLTISSRQRPAWNLPRLLLKGELLELDEPRLRMSRREYEALRGQLAAGLEECESERIWGQAHGWWGGVCLLLAGADNGARLLRDYLEHEVTARLSAEECELLHGLCHLPRFSAELCAQLWEGRGGVQLLQRLRQQQAFVLPVADQEHWYRIHPLVAAAFQGSLEVAELARLRLHSCRLLSVAGHLHEAIDQALRAQQPEVAATYMERLQPTWQLTDRHLQRLLEWRRQLPIQLLESTPRLIYLSALALLFSGRVEEAGACLETLSNFLPAPTAAQNQHLLAYWQALRGGVQAALGEVADAQRNCQEALDHLSEEGDDWLSRLLCYFTLGRALVASGRLDEAHPFYLGALEQARRQGCLDGEALLQGDLLRLLMLRGDSALAELLLEDCLGARMSAQIDNDPLLGRLLFLRSELLLRQGRIEAAERALSEGQQHIHNCSAPFVLFGYLGQAEIAGMQGDPLQAQLQIHRGERAMQCGRIDPACYRAALSLQQLKVLAVGEAWQDLFDGAGRLAAEHPLGASLSTSLPPSLPHEVQLLAARAEYQLGRWSCARRRLQLLVDQCARFTFRHLQQEAQRMLDELACQSPIPDDEPSGYLEELTGRESAVLELLAKGLSNREIADALFLSVNTVKYHAKNINAKLGTARRTQAIACAKARGLLA